jgi:hypothetical protein
MKRKNLIFVMLLVLSALYTMQSCKKDSAVAFTEQQAFTIPTLVAPGQGFLDLTGTTVDLKWESTNAGGAPNNFTVYFSTGDDPAIYQKNVTTTSLTVNVVPGTKYVWRVVATDANGITQTSPIWSFETVDPNAPLDMTMKWSTDALAAIGLDITPTSAVDLRLLIRKADKSALATVQTTGFEDYANWNTLPDGKYYVATDVYATVDAGDFNSPITVSIDLNFKQRGIQNEVVSFSNVLTNRFVCSSYRVYLGYLVKTGSTYVFTKEVTYPVSALSHVWNGTDVEVLNPETSEVDVTYDSEVETYLGCSLQVKGLVYGWMGDFWGEDIIKGGSASITINTTTGVVSIPLQYYCTTKYNGAVQTPYNIVGTGTYDATGAFPTMTINYTLVQGGTDIGQWMFDNGYMASNKFVATLTLNPAGLKALSTGHHTTLKVQH